MRGSNVRTYPPIPSRISLNYLYPQKRLFLFIPAFSSSFSAPKLPPFPLFIFHFHYSL